jgi:hypothetical protein
LRSSNAGIFSFARFVTAGGAGSNIIGAAADDAAGWPVIVRVGILVMEPNMGVFA